MSTFSISVEATTNPAIKQIKVMPPSAGSMPKSLTVIDKRALIGITISSACKLEMTDCVENTDAIIEVINTATIRLRTFRVTLGKIGLAH